MLLPTKQWLCMNYSICNLNDFQTISAIPDLLKHESKFIKYFGLHFFNNGVDSPPLYCKIDFSEANDPNGKPNIIRAVKSLLDDFTSGHNLSLIEFSYLLHLLADLHQPFHCNPV